MLWTQEFTRSFRPITAFRRSFLKRLCDRGHQMLTVGDKRRCYLSFDRSPYLLSRLIVGVQAWVLSCTRPRCSPLCPPLRIGAAGEFRVRRLPVRPHLRRAATAARSATSAGTDQNPDVRVGAGAAAATSVAVGRAGVAATSSSIVRFVISTGVPVVS